MSVEADLDAWTIAEAGRRLRARELSATELTRAALERIGARNAALNAFITVASDDALRAAAAADARLAAGTAAGPLDGIPVAVKDVIATACVRTTAASRILADFVPPYDATVTARLKAAGAIIVGKTNCDEFAMGSSNENSAYGSARNPWDLTRVPGGSSGGSAVAVAAGMALGSLGTDTGGSIRLPASYCGVVGMKPTYGAAAKYLRRRQQLGVHLEADHRLVGGAGAGTPIHGAHDAAPTRGGRRVCHSVAVSYARAVRAAVDTLGGLGARAGSASLPHTEYAVATYYVIATAEASSNLARYDGVRYGSRLAGDSLLDMYCRTRAAGFGPEVKRRIMLGTYALSAGYYDAYYLKAQKVRTLIRRDFARVFEQADVIVTPTAPTTAFRLGEKLADPLQMYLSDIFTISVNLAGLPGIVVPCGVDDAGLPIGLQIVGPPFGEEVVLRTARAYEAATEWHTRRPPRVGAAS
ncbi:MAG: aspartyl/glutamyl-tRNA amidotransferase subunit A [Deltaproteobacteria bacterium]|nr:MAG: aspartyl/glutamyl-tRNA amidotransferase subunit A [Deltaproteobacteria bacterium]